MTMSKDLFLSILAMDAYNQGYEPGVLHSQNQIGGATARSLDDIGVTSDEYLVWQTADFYALTYEITDASQIEGWGNETKVLAYRGTNSSLDHLTGWFAGAGDIATGTQAGLALEFYNKVAAQTYDQGADDDLILTGHSLGGGLAGLASVLSGTEGVGFDHMTYSAAAWMQLYLDEKRETEADADLSVSEVRAKLAEFAETLPFDDLHMDAFRGTHVANEILEGLRDGSLVGYGGALLTALTALVGATTPLPNISVFLGLLALDEFKILTATYAEEAGGRQVLDPAARQNPLDLLTRALELHMGEFAVVMQYAEDFAEDEAVATGLEQLEFETWKEIAEPLWDAYFSDDVAKAAGFADMFGNGDVEDNDGISEDPSIHKTKQVVRQATELPPFFPVRTTFTPSL